MNSPKIKQLIHWEKWKDPFSKEIDEDEEDEERQWKDFEDEEIHGPSVMTPMGLLHLNSHSSLSKKFNFWLAHTNFNITSRIKNILESVEGVETLDIFTRYRMRVGIGKLFDDMSVKREIDKILAQHLKDK